MESIEITLAKRAVNCSKWQWRQGMLSQNVRIMYWYYKDQYVGLNQDTNKKELFTPDLPDFLDAITIGILSNLVEDLLGKNSNEFKMLRQCLETNGIGREYLKSIIETLEKVL